MEMLVHISVVDPTLYLYTENNLTLRYKSEDWKCGTIRRSGASVQSFKKGQYFKKNSIVKQRVESQELRVQPSWQKKPSSVM